MTATNNEKFLQTTEKYANDAKGAMHQITQGANKDANAPDEVLYERDSCVFYNNWLTYIERFPEDEQLQILKMILKYSLRYEEPVDDNSVAYKTFILLKINIDNAEEHYNFSVESGRKGGRPSQINKDLILDMYFNKGIKTAQIARQLNYKPNTVKSIIQRNKKTYAKGANPYVYEYAYDNDDVYVKDASSAPASSCSATSANNSASLTQQAAPAETKETEKTFTYDDEVSVMKLFQQHKRPSEICTLTGFPSYFVNASIDKFRENNNRLPKPPVDHSKMIMCTDGSVFMNKEEYFNDCTNNGKNNINEIPWDIIKENLIEYKAIDPDEIINEMKDKLLQMQSKPLFLIA